MISPGWVFLVGAGPGDPGLITVRGLDCLRGAQVVVYDRLVHPSLLAEAPQGAELIDVGKQPDYHPAPQVQINAILVSQALAGKTVCRLKGGDPFVFGRGGEEAEALALAGIPFEVVPGVTSALAAPAYAGIPVTHRDVACSFAVVTGHRTGGADAACDWARAAGADTLVFLMGVSALPEIAARLISSGRDPELPCAVIERGAWPCQRTIMGTLATIAQRAAEASVRPPATLVVGEVVGLRERLRWYDRLYRRPLLGLRVLNTRPAPDAAELSRALRLAGAEPVELPATEIADPEDLAPLDAAIRECADRAGEGTPPFDWIGFTSPHAVAAFFGRAFKLGYDSRIVARCGLAAVGPATAGRLREFGLVADLVPDRAAGRHLSAALGDVAGRRILLARSNVALRDLPDSLAARGAVVTEVVAYVTRPAGAVEAALSALLKREIDAVTFFSPSAVDGIAAMVAPKSLGEVLEGVQVVCAGETTAAAARARSITAAVADGPSAEEIVAALRRRRD